MRKFFTIVATLCSVLAFSQSVVKANDGMFISINFPSKIEHFKSSQPDLIEVENKEENLFIQYLSENPNIKPSNILVKTIDGHYYSIIVEYEKEPKELNYFFNQSHSIQQLGGAKSKPMSTDKGIDLEKISKDIISKGGYINNRNIVINKRIEVIHKGIYFEKGKMFFLFHINNNSNIPFDVENISFEILPLNENSMIHQPKQITPIYIHNDMQVIAPKSKNKIVFAFDTFTMSDDKKLRFTINEKGGDRNIIYEVFQKAIETTKKVK